jgi:hypothetical protein
VAGATDDDAMMMWLSDRSPQAAKFVKDYLLSHPATGNTVNGESRTLASSGLARVYTGGAASGYFGVPLNDPRHPDVWGVVQHGVVYTGGRKKIAEHGGADQQDRDVPLVVFAPAAPRARRVRPARGDHADRTHDPAAARPRSAAAASRAVGGHAIPPGRAPRLSVTYP